jgi:hypothetical protein
MVESLGLGPSQWPEQYAAAQALVLTLINGFLKN